MKKIINSFLAAALVAAFACKKKDDPKPVEDNSNLVTLSGNLSTQTLDAGKKYLLKGQVFVNEGSVLTIPAGTVVMGDKASKGTLIINTGGKLMAEGTAEKPIIFTSRNEPGARDKGDWGGIVLLGRANVNQNNPTIEGITPEVHYGTYNSTTHNNENSGVLKYVRIEYAGIALSPNNETNGLTFGAIGSGTTIENIQVSFGGDDSYEWFGGTVNCKNLVALASWDDDFDTDYGYQGNVQFALSIRDPFAADQSGSNAFESDNNGGASTDQPYTAPVFSNVTVLGPLYDSLHEISGNYQHAMHLRRRTALSLFNSVIAGYPTGFRIEGTETQDQYNAGTGAIENNIMVVLRKKGAASPDTVKAGSNSIADVYKVWKNGNNEPFYPYTISRDNIGLQAAGLTSSLFFGANTSYPADPGFGSLGTSGASADGADFTSGKIDNDFFTTTTYRGAFGGSDWTDGWANFDPQHLAY